MHEVEAHVSLHLCMLGCAGWSTPHLAGLCRLRLEVEVEGAYQERLQRRCYQEQVEKQRLYRWGGSSRAQAMQTPHCQEFNKIFGNRQYYSASQYAF